MIRHLTFLLGLCLVLSAGCIDPFDASWFSPERLEEYSLWNNEIDTDYIELVSLDGLAVTEEEEAPTLAGIWAHQCLDDGNCASPAFPEFDPARQDKTIL